MTLRDRMSLGYSLAMTLLLGGWIGFINSAQQVFADVFLVPTLFPAIFAACSICMAGAALLNSRLVERLGMRPLSHLALAGYIAVSFAQAGFALGGQDTLLRFALLQSAMMFCFGLMAGNFGAIAMEPLGHVAGTAASVQGFITMLGAAAIGLFIGQHFNGSLVPLTIGFCACSLAGIAVISIAESGHLFRVRADVINPQ
jgi:DHA1 family bicyclomycin/chloramphenicol resistance-like MFS transporter